MEHSFNPSQLSLAFKHGTFGWWSGRDLTNEVAVVSELALEDAESESVVKWS